MHSCYNKLCETIKITLLYLYTFLQNIKIQRHFEIWGQLLCYVIPLSYQANNAESKAF